MSTGLRQGFIMVFSRPGIALQGFRSGSGVGVQFAVRLDGAALRLGSRQS